MVIDFLGGMLAQRSLVADMHPDKKLLWLRSSSGSAGAALLRVFSAFFSIHGVLNHHEGGGGMVAPLFTRWHRARVEGTTIRPSRGTAVMMQGRRGGCQT